MNARRLGQLALFVAVSGCSAQPSGLRSNRGSVAGASATLTEHSAAGEGSSEGDTPPPSFTWCEAQPILADKCGRCHGDPPTSGAPFTIASYADTQRVDARGRPRYERMQEAIETDLMPALFVKLEPEVEPLSEMERQRLLDWLAAGAPAGDADACPSTP